MARFVVAVPPILLPVSVASLQNPPQSEPFTRRHINNWLNKLIIPLVLLASTLGFAQSSAGNAPQVGEVSTDTLNIHLSIPLVSKKGIGLPFAVNMSYDSNFYGSYFNGTTKVWSVGTYRNFSAYGWTDVSLGTIGQIDWQHTRGNCGLGLNQNGWDPYLYTGYTEPSGAFHPIMPVYVSSDGSMAGMCTTVSSPAVVKQPMAQT